MSNSTLSRIERGLISADNRFVLAEIAAALEWSMAELTGQPVVPADAITLAAQTGVHAIRQALIEADFADPPTVTPRPMSELERETALLQSLYLRVD